MSRDLVDVVGVSTSVANAIRRVYDEHGRDDLPANVLAAARTDEVLHGLFEWDDSKAGEAYRLAQAANLVRRVRVRVVRGETAEPITVRAYVARRELPATSEDAPAGSYVAIEELAGQTEYEGAVIDAIRRDLARVRRKYGHVQEFFRVALAELSDG